MDRIMNGIVTNRQRNRQSDVHCSLEKHKRFFCVRIKDNDFIPFGFGMKGGENQKEMAKLIDSFLVLFFGLCSWLPVV
jgi:hypothetical protein